MLNPFFINLHITYHTYFRYFGTYKYNFTKMTKVYVCPNVENSPNLVTIILSQNVCVIEREREREREIEREGERERDRGEKGRERRRERERKGERERERGRERVGERKGEIEGGRERER
jgi:hypothetical protein